MDVGCSSGLKRLTRRWPHRTVVETSDSYIKSWYIPLQRWTYSTSRLITPDVEWTTDVKAGRSPNFFATGPCWSTWSILCESSLYISFRLHRALWMFCLFSDHKKAKNRKFLLCQMLFVKMCDISRWVIHFTAKFIRPRWWFGCTALSRNLLPAP